MFVYGISKQVIGVDEFPVCLSIQFPITGVYHDMDYKHDAALKITTMMMIKFLDIVKELPKHIHIVVYSSMDSKKIGKYLSVEEFRELVKDVIYVEESPWLKCFCDYCRG